MDNHPTEYNASSAETERLKALYRYQILDTPADPSFDNITLLASKLLNVPISLISFVDEHRIWSKSHHGVEVQEYKRIDGLCATTILNNSPYIVENASTDPRSCEHPLVTQLAGVRFYAGVPLTVENRFNIGTLCVIDYKPRELSASEIETLKLLSKMVVDVIELHVSQLKINDLNKTLKTSEHYFRSMFDQAGVGVSIANAKTGEFVQTNQKYLEIIGYAADELKTLDLMLITHPDDVEKQKAMTRALLAGEVTEYHLEKRYIRKDQTCVWVDITCTALWMAGDSPTHHLAIVQEITDKKLAELALKENEERWSFALEGSNQGVWDLDVVNHKIFLSPRCKDMLGYPQDEISTDMDAWLKLIHPDDLPCLISARADALCGNTRSFENEHRKLSADGSWKWVQVKGMVVSRDNSGAPLRVIGTYTDISQRKQIEAQVLKLAHFDSITNLPNRTLFLERLNQEIEKTRQSKTSLALMMLDLDRFKEVNDSLGHHQGDLLIKITAQRLLACVQEKDTVCRLGGDEFTIIFSELSDGDYVHIQANKILEAIAEPYQLGGDLAYVTASIGIAVYPADSSNADELVRQSDQAMYASKNSGKNRYAFFTKHMEESALQKLNLANHLRSALAKNEFKVLYQPIVDLNNMQIRKAEALIRWQHPDMGIISPADFIPIAEDTGLIVEIGEWVFKQAVEAIKTCRQHVHPEFKISINKSPVQFRSESIGHAEWFDYLASNALPGNSLIVEITEGLLLDTSEQVNRQLNAFKHAGIQIALDDFGTGYSSLSYLKQYDIDFIKIDQIFVKNLSTGSEDLALCEAIIMMAHKLNMRVVAEGVETVEQLELLKAAGCDFAQGYLFSRPIELAHLLKLNLS
jgi:diguanylate cyclase (GGDEF)-like protein/PAS domain S-box-containing protein